MMMTVAEAVMRIVAKVRATKEKIVAVMTAITVVVAVVMAAVVE